MLLGGAGAGWGATLPPGAAAQEIEVDRDEPALITADEVLFDEPLGLVVARGSVEVSQGERLLRADEVVYNTRTDVVTASGNVVLVDPDSGVLFSDYAELQGDLAEGFINTIGIVLSDNSRLAATTGVRREDRVTEVERAVYSPCRLCEEDPTRPPLWQLRAVRVIQDRETQDIIYRDAFLDFFGIPVLYTPYLRHPDPSVEQRSGLLTPSIGRDGNLGTFVNVPYYIAISPSRDLTVTGGLTTDAGPLLRGLYRDRYGFGEIEVDGSVNYSNRLVDEGEANEREEQRLRGHLFADGEFSIDQNWRAEAAIALTSDDTYLDTFNITDADVLRTSGLVEGFFDLSYARAEVISYRDLRDQAIRQPLVAPMLSYSHVGTPGGLLGGTWSTDASFLHLRRNDVEVSRLAAEALWSRRDILPIGLVSDLEAGFRQDLYLGDGVTDPDVPDGDSVEFASRTVPHAAWRLSYPWIRDGDGYRHIVEPLVGVFAAAEIDNDTVIPNNDSLDSEFNDINLFASDRFTGADRVEDGVRVAYGVRNTLLLDGGGRADVFLGQSLRIAGNSDFPDGSDEERRTSDLVGRIDLAPIPELDFSYRFQIDPHDFGSLRHEIAANGEVLGMELSASYFFIDQSAGLGLTDDQAELTLAGSLPVTDNWLVDARWRRDLDARANREIAVGAQYEDECFIFRIDYRRDFTEDRDRDGGNSVLLQVGLRNLGQPVADPTPTPDP
ncbi:MAG: LPS-assembly protein LptD [Rhodospirillaceae bacterium]|nr:LPS-assembly protein LptD [Rhodospirillaceae bacterium]